MSSYRTLRAEHHAEPEPTKGSRFLASVAPADAPETAEAFLAKIRTEHANATHHCWAFAIREPMISRSSDDGEPSGSAGRPLLATLTGRALTNVVVVVTRYFGGTKLGVGGLIRAYTGAAALALDAAEVVEIREMRQLTVEYDHGLTSVLEAFAVREDLTVVDRIYGERVCAILEVASDDYEQLCARLVDVSGGRIKVVSRA